MSDTFRLVDPNSLGLHPVVDIFPPMSGAEFSALVDDIRENGIREAVWTYKNQVVDGKHRREAAIGLGIQLPVREWDGEGGSLVGFVVSLNLHRRHLSESQRAMVAARLANMPQGARTDLLPIGGRLVSQSDAAELLKVSEHSLQRAAKVLRSGAGELQQAVSSGEVAVSTAADVSELPLGEQLKVVARGEKAILAAAKEIRARRLEHRREERVTKLAEISAGNAELATDRIYPVIYADPPWRYEHAESESRAIENQYPTMSLDEICELPVEDIATDDAILFLWATSPKLAEAMRVVEAWGFNYRTCAVWDKEKIGMGYWFRQQHELLLVAAKGTMPTPAPSARVSSVIREVRGEHSAKPVRVYEIIEAMYPTLPRVELFCRSPRDGWGSWGNQAQ